MFHKVEKYKIGILDKLLILFYQKKIQTQFTIISSLEQFCKSATDPFPKI